MEQTVQMIIGGAFLFLFFAIGYFVNKALKNSKKHEESNKVPEEDELEPLPNITPGPKQEQWLRYLEEHPDEQLIPPMSSTGRGKLGEEINGKKYTCCLGKFGELNGLCYWHNRGVLELMNGSTNSVILGEGFDTLGLRTSTGSSSHELVEKYYPSIKFNSLAYMNDHGISWPEIAAHVRKYFPIYFTKSV